ncbi:checkpoint clamp complex protein Rad1 [Schizosaccharomyces japonicus yFS275]|uniref:Checkpoint clamp complex protein Rad1 n=1 Tax=Schizosaccharomyces japonicus (strain yFS275 / FY16936) TaxID=402676 RepID=B6K149_SCHJY|nr:checkpoint clamp complex protein Rad1 [Schizosaccharomyces japonicus yFS275]EEB07670.1 checkpoint clamp complex protein Rad1 [Schizosaccharomyces japonicus yFS275]
MFEAETTQLKHIFLSLRCIDFVKECTVEIYKKGIKFGVDESQSLDAHIYLQKPLFTDFKVGNISGDEDEAVYAFKIQLQPLLHCLSIYAESKDRMSSMQWDQPNPTGFMKRHGTRCIIRYHGKGDTFDWIIEDATGYKTTCELNTMEENDAMKTEFIASRTTVKVIMKSKWLYDALLELDNNLSDSLLIKTLPEKSTFALRSIGSISSTEVEYPSARNVLESFKTMSEYVHAYRFSLVRHALKALQASSKASIQIDENGLLNLQLMLLSPQGLSSFVDFKILPLNLNEGEDEQGSDWDGRGDSETDDADTEDE